MQTRDVDSRRAVDELKELAELTGGPDGARRVAWTGEWVRAREWLTGKLEEIEGVEVDAVLGESVRERDAVSVLELAHLVRVEDVGGGARSQEAPPEARPLLIRPVHEP